MKINTGIPAHDLNVVGAAARAAEANGFSGISTQENRQDPFLPLAVAAETMPLELAVTSRPRAGPSTGLVPGVQRIFQKCV